MTNKKHDIAVIGMSCWYPGAKSPLELWENILTKRQQFRKIPDERLPLDKYQDDDKNVPDMTYGTEAAVLDGFEFDWQGLRIPKKTVEGTDIVHWLALDVAVKALKDAGYDEKSIKKYNTGVILGNTLTGEWTRTNAMRMRWPHVRDSMIAAANAHGIVDENFEEYLKTTEEAFKSVFPDVTEDTLSGALSNTIAGRVCNFLDLHGGGYTIDGACSSSLLAVINAAQSLNNGDLDVAFAGGIDISLDTFELIGFAKTGALTDSDMRVYDKRASGFIPGEGCGFIILKRLEDAIADGDQVLATLNGWGISSDGKGGLTAPSVRGQSQAIQTAYGMADYGLKDVDFIEGHGTGTPLGDRVEVGALADALKKEEGHETASIGLTSLKTIIGHAKAAAGIGALIKAIISVNRRVVPPLAGSEFPHAIFNEEAKHLYPLIDGYTQDESTDLIAGVSAMGFGGINSHVTLKSGPEVSDELEPEWSEDQLMASYDKFEVFPFSSEDVAGLKKEIQQTMAVADKMARGEMLDLAADLSRKVLHRHSAKAAVVSWKPADLVNKLEKLLAALSNVKDGEVLQDKDFTVSLNVKKPNVAIVFPGQGSQQANMGSKLYRRHQWAKDMVNDADRVLAKEDLSIEGGIFHKNLHKQRPEAIAKVLENIKQTEFSQPSIVLNSALWMTRLKKLGIKANAVAGHSLGELTALWAAGSISFQDLIQMATLRGRFMSAKGDAAGSMAFLGCTRIQAEELLSRVDGYLTIANLNSDGQTIVSGDKQAIQDLIKLAESSGLRSKELSVSNAFHSKYMDEASQKFAAALKDKSISAPKMKLYSGLTAKELGDEDLSAYLAKQMLGEVNYIGMIRHIAESHNTIIEVGPNSVLTGLNKQILGDHVNIISTDNRDQDDEAFKSLLAKYFVAGGKLKWNEVYQDRYVKPFIAASDRLFIENPCEREIKIEAKNLSSNMTIGKVESSATIAATSATTTTAVVDTVEAKVEIIDSNSNGDIILDTVHELTGFDRDTLTMDMRVLDDLNMDSIKASELVSAIAVKVGRPGEIDFGNFANASLQELADAMDGAPAIAVEGTHAGVPQLTAKKGSTFYRSNKTPWVRSFIEKQSQKDVSETSDISQKSMVIIGATEHAKTLARTMVGKTSSVREYAKLADFIASPDHSGDILALFFDDLKEYSTKGSEELIADLHSLAKMPPSGSDRKLLFVQDNGQKISLKSFASSISQERKDLSFAVVNHASDVNSESFADKLVQEVSNTEKLSISFYDTSLERQSIELVLAEPKDRSNVSQTLGKEDVIIVTGGAKGITAASALALGEKSGARFALVGSTPMTEEPTDRTAEIFETLKSFNEAGLEAKYYSCNILNSEDVAKTVDQITDDLGQVTGLVNGAGVNKPSPAIMSDKKQAEKEFNVKVLGAHNFAENLDQSRLKFFVSLTSVIGVLGMQGNAWYALANESLDRMSRGLKAKHPKLHTVSLAYSVWAEVGMGAKLGSVDRLEEIGVSSIIPEQGISRFVDSFYHQYGDQQLVITSRMGDLDGKQAESHDFRYIDELVSYHKGVETISKVTLKPETDSYLLDHNYKGTYLFPTVFGLEAMAQAVCYTLGLDSIEETNIENIELTKPITVSDHGDEIEIYAEVLERTNDKEIRVKTGIRCAKTGYKYDHFSAEYVLSEVSMKGFEKFESKLSPIGIDPQVDLYGPILFQGKKFQRIKEIYQLESDDENEGMTIFRSAYEGGKDFRMVLGDPYYRDSLLQSAQLIIPKNQCLPVKISKLKVSAASLDASRSQRVALSDVHRVDAKSFTATITVMDDQGHIVEVMEDYRLQFIERVEDNPRALDLINEEKGAHMNLQAHISKHDVDLGTTKLFSGNGLNDIDLMESIAQHMGLKEDEKKNLFGLELDSGAHQLSIGNRTLHISASQDNEKRVCSASWDSIKPVSLAINKSKALTDEEFKGFSSKIHDFKEIGVKCEQLSTRLAEVQSLALQSGMDMENCSIKYKRHNARHIEFNITSGKSQLDIASIHVSGVDERIYSVVKSDLAKVIVENESAPVKEEPVVPAAVSYQEAPQENKLLAPYMRLSEILKINAEPNGPQGQSVFVNSFIPDFKAFSNLGRSVYFSQFFNWMGSARELSSVPVLDRIRELTETGRWGLVTNWASINVLGQVRNTDRIVQVRMWCGSISGAQESSVTLNFDWVSLGENGIEERVATGKMGFTWVEIIGHGIVKPAPFPDYYREFIDSMIAQNEDQDAYVPAPEPMKDLNPGTSLFKAPKGPGMRVGLTEKVYETSLFDANLVGNLYFGNYSIWMGKIRDKYFQNLIPEYYLGIGENGELRCKDSKIQHLREAMPFDDIRVTMSISELYEGGFDLYFEFFKVVENGQDEKLAYGEHKAVWSVSDESGNVKQIPLPEKVLEHLKKQVAEKSMASVG